MSLADFQPGIMCFVPKVVTQASGGQTACTSARLSLMSGMLAMFHSIQSYQTDQSWRWWWWWWGGTDVVLITSVVMQGNVENLTFRMIYFFSSSEKKTSCVACFYISCHGEKNPPVGVLLSSVR